MRRPFSTKDARNLINKHTSLLKHLNSVVISSDQYRNNIINACVFLKSRETMNALRYIPIEELNRSKQRIRTKTLRDNGYRTIADIYKANENSLSLVKGISYDSAQKAKQIASAIAEETQKKIHIKLSADDRNPAATDLVRSIAIYNRSVPNLDICKSLLLANNGTITNAINKLKPAKCGLRWLFSSKITKENAVTAYEELVNLLDESYFEKANQAILALDEAKETQGDDAWNDFKENSIAFFIILEKINPGFIHTSDTFENLPENSISEIQNEVLLLNGLRCSLRRYQELGVKYILRQKRVLLGDEMGLGKTIQAIATMVSLKNNGATHFMVVCPASVVTNWCREIAKHSSLDAIKIHGSDRLIKLNLWLKSGGVAVTTYEMTHHISIKDSYRFSLLVADEAHYIKNPKAQRSIYTASLCRHADRLLFMTGTPLENNVHEMINLIKLLQPKIAKQIARMLFQSAAPQFRETISPVYYRRKREEVLAELPELIENQEWCSLSEEEENVYEQAILDKRYFDARRVSWNIENLAESTKAKRLLDIVEQAKADGRKVIVFSFFLDTIKKIQLFLGDRCVNTIHGSVRPQRRQEIIDEFDKAPAGSVLIAQIQAGGTGVNIQSASVVIICEPQFKPSIENQAISRAYRMGQSRNVLVYRLLAENTIDERITDILEEKSTIFHTFADKSTLVEDNFVLDEKMFGNIIQEELNRIQAKRGLSSNQQELIESDAKTSSEEYRAQMALSYSALVEFLLKKYGPAKGSYFTNDSFATRNPKISRTQEGLYCHHIDEDKAIKLSDSNYAKKHPFAYQQADRLVYCNILEHLLLHVKIIEQSQNSKIGEKEFLGIGGAICFLCPEINDFYNGHTPLQQWKSNTMSVIADNFDDYISILRYFLSITQKDSLYRVIIPKESLAMGSQGDVVTKIYNQL